MRNENLNVRNNLVFTQFLLDALFAFAGISCGYFLRFHSPLQRIGIKSDGVTYSDYLPVIIAGVIFLNFTFASLGVYNWKILLRPKKQNTLIIKGTTFWFLVYLSLSLTLKFEPAISRVFMTCSWIVVTGFIILGKRFYITLLCSIKYDKKLVQNVAIIGWNEDAKKLSHYISKDVRHPYTIQGIVLLENSKVDRLNNVYRNLGTLNNLENVLKNEHLDILVVADLNLSREEIARIAKLCEIYYVDFKITPSMFQIFEAGLRLEYFSGMPVLGIEELLINKLTSLLLKRSVDIFGAIVGLVISFPFMAVLSFLIKKEDGGPVLYRQTRTGKHGKTFTIYKLRSMRINAEQKGGAQWAKENDPRRLKIGAFMRETNLDEIPQFWNVLKGDMSLVGPRPERPELIDIFEKEIDHYNHRHEVKPGMTGWAQVNGLRGDTSITDRIQHDIYYIENWNLIWDFQILLLTLIKRENAY